MENVEKSNLFMQGMQSRQETEQSRSISLENPL